MTMMKNIAVAARDRKRLQEIAGVLVRFGLDDLLRLSGFPSSGAADYPARVCAALEELGPTFVKLGQILSTRSDLLPPAWIAALGKLHSRATPVPYEDICAQIVEDLGAAPEDLFSSFDPAPLASGSIAQIYRARLKGGDDIVLKVQRPGIAPVIAADIRILTQAAQFAESQVPALRRYRLPEIVRILGAAMHEELDFTREGHNAEEIAAQFTGQDDIVTPRVYWDYCHRRIMAQAFIAGYAPENPDALRAAGLNPEYLARRGTDAVLQMIFVDGVFHGDPHPGNILCLSGNRIAFLDFGMVGRISLRRRDELMGLIDAIAHEKGERVRDILMKWSGAAHVDLEGLDTDAAQFVARHRAPPLDFSQAIADFMTLARTHDLILPADMALLFKALVTAEGVARRLDPRIDIIAQAAPVARQALFPEPTPEMLRALAAGVLAEGRYLAVEMPGALRGILRVLQRGRVGVDMEVGGMERWMRTVEHAATRLAVGIVVAAFALGLAPHLMTIDREMIGWPAFTLAGLAAVAGGFVWLVLSGRERP